VIGNYVDLEKELNEFEGSLNQDELKEDKFLL